MKAQVNKTVHPVIRVVNSCRCKMHDAGHKWYHVMEHGCAIGYGIHEVFHWTLPVIILSYGLLGCTVMVIVGIVASKGV